jgi:hypothetical protein
MSPSPPVGLEIAGGSPAPLDFRIRTRWGIIASKSQADNPETIREGQELALMEQLLIYNAARAGPASALVKPY